MASESKEMEVLINGDPKIFERFVLGAVISSKTFYEKYKSLICPREKDFIFRRNDFSVFYFNTVYDICATFWEAAGDGTPDELSVPLNNWILPNVLSKVEEGTIEPRHVNKILADMNKLYSELSPVFTTLAEKGVLYWLGQKITTRVLNKVNETPHLFTPDELIQTLQQHTSAIQDKKETNAFSFMEILEAPQDEGADTMFSGFPHLDRAIGNGFQRGGTTMIGAATGGGKTICATQLASSFVYQGLNVLFITTEQSGFEILCRFVCQNCSINFKHFITRGAEALPKEILEMEPYKGRYDEMVNNFSQHLVFMDWSSKMDMSALATLDGEISKLAKKGWNTDIIIFDWIGGGIDKSNVRDFKDLAILMNRTADYLKNVAKIHKLHAIFTVQLDKEKSKDKAVLDSSMVQGSKQMSDYAQNAIFITNIRDKRASTDSATDVYLKNQFFCVDKARKGPPTRIPIEREGEFQRFKERVGGHTTLQH